jgi:hypothetical protein
MERLRALRGRLVCERGGSSLGTVIEVLFHRDSRKAWIVVDTG